MKTPPKKNTRPKKSSKLSYNGMTGRHVAPPDSLVAKCNAIMKWRLYILNGGPRGSSVGVLERNQSCHVSVPCRHRMLALAVLNHRAISSFTLVTWETPTALPTLLEHTAITGNKTLAKTHFNMAELLSSFDEVL